jgi:hypothetical protein
MVVYTPTNFSLSPEHVSHILMGGKMKIEPAMMGGKVKLGLTRSQCKSLEKHAMSGKSWPVHMSMSQRRHHVRHGRGYFGNIYNAIKEGVDKSKGGNIFGDIWGGLKTGVSDVWNGAVKPNLGRAADFALKKAGAGVSCRGLGGPVSHIPMRQAGFGMKKRKGGRMLFGQPAVAARAYGMGTKKRKGGELGVGWNGQFERHDPVRNGMFRDKRGTTSSVPTGRSLLRQSGY